jgi:geranylgeranyl diphosphate synthase type II
MTRSASPTALRVLVSAIGTRGMIGGQVDDLLATGGPVVEARVRSIHARKTGALLRACPVIGGILAEAPDDTLALLDSYGTDVGLAFQIVDDVLDVESTAAVLGKSVGKDAASGKATFPAAIGMDASKALAAELSARAAETARALGPRALPLAAIAEYVARRER